MTLIKSISGIRGTIGGGPSNNLTPLDVVRFTSAYAQFLLENSKKKLTVITGRDARISGPMVHELVNQTLIGMGINVIDLGLSTTPTVAIAVSFENANGGIIVTASHNTKQWNALKLLNAAGEFINADTGAKVLAYAENNIDYWVTNSEDPYKAVELPKIDASEANVKEIAPDDARVIVKNLLLVSMNAKNETAAFQAFNSNWDYKKYPYRGVFKHQYLKQLLDNIIKAHPKITDLIFCGKGNRLINKEV